MRYDNVIWDWNGTLLNDVSVAVKCMNELLSEYGLSPLASEDYYRSVFCFPVKDYYARLGFDFEKTPFEITGMEFIEKYDKYEQTAPLAEGAIEALSRFREAGLRQVVLSASELSALKKQISDRALTEYFADILGIDNRLAAGKAEIARGYFAVQKLSPARTVFIGDTEHDFAVASALGCDCVLLSCGHKSREALQKLTDKVADSVKQAAEIILSER
ncbi:MAG: HAD family hydrolase [Oscillospiraceae bacterium]|nr:HAD family hydrolase [Oscillospiraceae bacterium]